MADVALTLFWTGLLVLSYTYAVYPLLLLLLVKLKKNSPRAGIGSGSPPTGPLPAVTLLIAAYNEESIIRQKIENTLQLEYPFGLLRILLVSDGSTDRTPSIIEEYPGIQHLHQAERKGKLAAVNRAMRYADTDLVVFSDANTVLNRSSIQKLVAHFADPRVGAVAGEKRVLTPAPGQEAVGEGEGLYWKYESFLKKLDSALYTTVGAAGELFAIRRPLYTFLPENTVIEDFVQSMLVCARGSVVRYEPGAFSLEQASTSLRDERERKTRIAAGGFQAIGLLKKLYNPLKHPVVLFQLISHRFLRWTLCPPAILMVLAGSLFLYPREGIFYKGAVWLQAVFYVAAAIGWYAASRNRRAGLSRFPFYFLFMHFCVLAGFARFIGKKQEATWRRAERAGKI